MKTSKIVLVVLLIALVLGAVYAVTTTVSAATSKSGSTGVPQCGQYCGDPTMSDLSDCRGCPTPMT